MKSYFEDAETAYYNQPVDYVADEFKAVPPPAYIHLDGVNSDIEIPEEVLKNVNRRPVG